MKKLNTWLLNSLTSPSLLRRSFGVFVHQAIARFVLALLIALASWAYMLMA